MTRLPLLLLAALAVACGSDSKGDSTPATTTPSTNPPPPATTTPVTAPPPPVNPSLKVRFLGVSGFLLSRGDDAIMTAPLYTRPNEITASTGIPVHADASAIDRHLPASWLTNVRAILSGHAHYDHLIDVPNLMLRTPQAKLYSNVSAEHLLAAYAPTLAPACTNAPVSQTIARERIVALDDPSTSVVDYRNCPNKKPEGAPLTGKWVDIPEAHARLYAVCSEHPAQVGPFHYGAGDVDKDECSVETNAAEWKEGMTLAYLVDFLDAASKPAYRVYYQDAPTNAPVGHIPADILADKRVDLDLLCVGAFPNVANEPTGVIQATNPRFVIGGHWEDFFQPVDAAPQPLPFHDMSQWRTRAASALPFAAEATRITVNGKTADLRYVMPMPDDVFEYQQ